MGWLLDLDIVASARLKDSGYELKYPIPDLDIPVQEYKDEKQVPEEFVIKDPKEIPNRIWGQNDESQKQRVSLPVIDIAPLISQTADPEDVKRVIAEIGKACEEWGYFQATNHGVPEQLLEQLVEAAGEFFSLPLEEKKVYAAKPGKVEGYGQLPQLSPGRLWNDMMRHTLRPKLSPEEIEERIPAKPAQYRPLVEEYTEEVEKLLDIVWNALSVYLDLQTNILRELRGGDGERIVVRLNYYPKCPEPEKVLGVNAHTDFGWITVLAEDQVGGLQVAKSTEDPVWLDVKPVKGSLLINMGKQIEFLTNGRLKAMLHRALVKQNEKRTSVAVFQFPSQERIIEPIQELVETSGEAARFKPLRYRDYSRNFTTDVLSNLNPYARYMVDPVA